MISFLNFIDANKQDYVRVTNQQQKRTALIDTRPVAIDDDDDGDGDDDDDGAERTVHCLRI
jgi:hypothetical protein